MTTKPSTYLLTAAQSQSYIDAAEVRISIWGVVPEALDQLVKRGLWGDTRAEVYYRLAMDRLQQLESEGYVSLHKRTRPI